MSRRPDPPPAWLPEARRLYDLGLNAQEVGDRVGRNGSTVLAWFHRTGHHVRRQGQAVLPPRAVVHLMVTDPAHPSYKGPDSEIFSACCGLNWACLIASGLVTARPELVTCPGRAA